MEDSLSSGSQPSTAPDVDLLATAMVNDDPSAYPTTMWDWGDFLDFATNEQLPFALDSDQPPFASPPPPSRMAEPESDPSSRPGLDRIRKRDPQLTCSNFLEGRIPCSCPEIEQNLADEGLPGKKRVRKGVRGGSGVARCQVPGCEVDISELKGYHRRHRVCLRCAHASSVVLDGETKRYCQQCGKFHVLPDFDEGKRSCRRKLERHNNRRRRKVVDNGGGAEKEQLTTYQKGNCIIYVDDEKACTDSICASDPIAEPEASLDRRISAQGVVPIAQNINAESVVSFAASRDAQTDEGKNNAKCELSPSCGDNRSAYSSVCPTGRISFKLYDWNPAEFPRRLRHQIFQWLASMPVELEGYIRPGCTILTVFIAMPEIMWAKLSKDPVAYLDEFVLKPGKMLFGRGSMTVYLNNMIFRHIKGGTSIKRVNTQSQAPRIQFVYPRCFEAGKPIELIACGSNFLQPKFRFLVSFSGKYLPYNYSVISSPGQDGKTYPSCNNKYYRIYIGNSDPNLFGPAFVEVENESGLSNFIPLIIGDGAICSEMKLIEQKFNATLCPEGEQAIACCSLTCVCEDFEQRQTAFSGLLLDIAWSVKVPNSECTDQTLNHCQIRRYNRVLNYLRQSSSASMLERVLQNLEILMKKLGSDSIIHCTNDSDVGLLHRNMNLAKDIFKRRQSMNVGSALPPSSCCCESSHLKDIASSISTIKQDLEAMQAGSSSSSRRETDPLLNKEVVMNVDVVREWPRKSCGLMYPARARPTAFLITTMFFCMAVCAVLYNPHKIH